MNKLKLFIQKLPLDKKEHCVLGVLTGLPTIIITLIFFGVLVANIVGVSCMIAYAYKEVVIDEIQGKGKMEFEDWLWTSIPVIMGLIILNIK